jgi:hypothetical protein
MQLDYLFFIPFVVQAIVIGIDETYYHIRRGLPRWERIGHPLDTLSVVLCLLFVLLVPFSISMAKVYAGIALFSCLMVTKDEFVHKHHCPVGEHWLHALLFINHPIMLASAGLMWAALAKEAAPSWLLAHIKSPEFFSPFLIVQAAFAVLFFFYQAIYWNFIWKEKTE